MPPSEIRKEAREALRGKWGKAVCIILVYLVLSFIIGFVESLVGKGTVLYTIIDLAYLVISIPLSFGLVISFMKLKRDEEISCFDFFKDGFSRFGKSWGILGHQLLRLALPIFVIILSVCLLSLNIFIGNLGILTYLVVAIYIISLIYGVSRSLLYVLSYYIGYDNPELSSKACVLKSEALMKGNRGSYFLLELSFIGWAILACFTLGIGFLWLLPYIQVATVCFYERVAKPEVKKIEEEVKIEE